MSVGIAVHRIATAEGVRAGIIVDSLKLGRLFYAKDSHNKDYVKSNVKTVFHDMNPFKNKKINDSAQLVRNLTAIPMNTLYRCWSHKHHN